MSIGLAAANENARSALGCGGSMPPWSYSSAMLQGGVEPPQSKVPSARSFSGQIEWKRGKVSTFARLYT